MFAGAKTGKVERKAIRPETNRTLSAYEVFLGKGRICALGVARMER